MHAARCEARLTFERPRDGGRRVERSESIAPFPFRMAPGVLRQRELPASHNLHNESTEPKRVGEEDVVLLEFGSGA